MTDLQRTASRDVARPLKVLVPLIKQDVEHGREAAEEAGLPFFRAAGEKLREARPQVGQGDWGPWCKRHFNISTRQALVWMNYAKGTTRNREIGIEPPRSLRDSERQQGNRNYGRSSIWQDSDIKDQIKAAREQAQALRAAELSRQQERDAERQLALRLIDIGWKVLAKELHPDRGGSRDAMTRLNRVRDRLKQTA